jgi:hypothetical protein
VVNDLWLTIPTGTRTTYLPAIIENAGIPQDKIVIVHTVEGEPIEGVHNIYDLDEINIHRWWNKGIKFAMDNGARYVAVLNDDVELADDPLNNIASAMNNSDATIGVPYPFTGHIPGYAWVLDTSKGIFPDENFRWWYGDDDLFRRAENIIAVACKIRHVEGNKLTSSNPELMELTKKDKEYYDNKWRVE